MKNHIQVFGAAIIASVLVAGCGQQPPNSNGDAAQHELTTEELARLLNFHAFKVRVPESKEPFKGYRIEIIKPDGTVVPKFVEETVVVPPTLESYLLVGFRVERETFSGNIEFQVPTNGTMSITTIPFSFTDPFADSICGWESSRWIGNRFLLASDLKHGGSKLDTVWSGGAILVLELVK